MESGSDQENFLRKVALHTFAVNGYVYGSAKMYEVLVPQNILPQSIDLPVRYHLASIAGAVAINTAASFVASDNRIMLDDKTKIMGAALLSSSFIALFEAWQSNLPHRSFDYIDAGGGIAAIFASAVLMHKLTNNQKAKSKTPPAPSAPGPE